MAMADAERPPLTEEERRLEAARTGTATWRRWGPYLA